MSDEPQTDDLQEKVQAAEEKAEEQSADEEVKNEVEDLKEALQRSMADMQNMKRRADEDKMRFIRFANAELLKKLLPIIANFDRACQQIPDGIKDDNWTTGVVSTHDELMKALDEMGVKKMETIGQKLDPTKHEAVMQDKGELDVILEEFEPGYILNNEVIKPAKVKVGNGEK